MKTRSTTVLFHRTDWNYAYIVTGLCICHSLLSTPANPIRPWIYSHPLVRTVNVTCSSRTAYAISLYWGKYVFMVFIQTYLMFNFIGAITNPFWTILIASRHSSHGIDIWYKERLLVYPINNLTKPSLRFTQVALCCLPSHIGSLVTWFIRTIPEKKIRNEWILHSPQFQTRSSIFLIPHYHEHNGYFPNKHFVWSQNIVFQLNHSIIIEITITVVHHHI